MKQRKKLGRKILSYALALAMVIGLMPGMSLTVHAEDQDPVSYMTWDENQKKQVEKTGDEACKEYVVVTAGTTTFEDGKWYVVKDTTVTVDDRINVNGTVNLILCDGTTLIASNGITVTESNSLTIYGQSEGTGTLTATGGEIYDSHALTFNRVELRIDGVRNLAHRRVA